MTSAQHWLRPREDTASDRVLGRLALISAVAGDAALLVTGTTLDLLAGLTALFFFTVLTWAACWAGLHIGSSRVGSAAVLLAGGGCTWAFLTHAAHPAALAVPTGLAVIAAARVRSGAWLNSGILAGAGLAACLLLPLGRA